MSVCVKCGESGSFYVSNLRICKECIKAAVRAHRAANIERVRIYDKQRNTKPHRVDARVAYQKAHPEIAQRAKKMWIGRNPEKRAAHIILGNAMRDGKIIRAKACERCGVVGRVEAHHRDYSKPLEVQWLCKRCHVAVHV